MLKGVFITLKNLQVYFSECIVTNKTAISFCGKLSLQLNKTIKKYIKMSYNKTFKYLLKRMNEKGTKRNEKL